MFDLILSWNPGWLGGVAIAFAGQYISKIVKIFLKRRKLTAFDGAWYCYYLTRDEARCAVVKEVGWVIKKHLIHDYQIETYSPENLVITDGKAKADGPSHYVGNVNLDGTAVWITFEGNGTEASVYRTTLPFHGSNFAYGVWEGLEWNRNIFASIFMLSSKRIDLGEAESKLSNEFSYMNDKGFKGIYKSEPVASDKWTN